MLIQKAIEMNVDLEDLTLASIFAKIVTLALLPANQIINGYDSIIGNVEQEQLQALNNFFNYYVNNWIRHVTPINFSCHNNTWQLLSNSELLNNDFAHRINDNKDLWHFVGE